MTKTSKAKKIKNKWKVIILFSFISLIILVNNISDLFAKLGLYASLQWIGWGGLTLVIIYNGWLASEDKI